MARTLTIDFDVSDDEPMNYEVPNFLAKNHSPNVQPMWSLKILAYFKAPSMCQKLKPSYKLVGVCKNTVSNFVSAKNFSRTSCTPTVSV